MSENLQPSCNQVATDLISRQAAIDALCTPNGILYPISTIEELPSAEREKGRWQVDTSGYGFWVCSACGFPSEAHAANMLYNFCPNCGADMRGEQDE